MMGGLLFASLRDIWLRRSLGVPWSRAASFSLACHALRGDHLLGRGKRWFGTESEVHHWSPTGGALTAAPDAARPVHAAEDCAGLGMCASSISRARVTA